MAANIFRTGERDESLPCPCSKSWMMRMDEPSNTRMLKAECLGFRNGTVCEANNVFAFSLTESLSEPLHRPLADLPILPPPMVVAGAVVDVDAEGWTWEVSFADAFRLRKVEVDSQDDWYHRLASASVTR
eukprot:CAMPEP_0168844298 /NCGR_PEP_ID=MMETSP0727-20121128/8667_1 /TAXON_ID=265536 /ORGANISM="Amphiprora sp., Strain CCMP467" /LENGTH=129 /DNA_ID=CAMNT_0008897941 /DNA_START=39 /DNA_END=428 /DNA_ORIENTATION=-